MTPTGLPALPPGLTEADRRAWTLWLHAAAERIERESRASSIDAAEARGRKAGAQRVAELLLSSLRVTSVVDSA